MALLRARRHLGLAWKVARSRWMPRVLLLVAMTYLEMFGAGVIVGFLIAGIFC